MKLSRLATIALMSLFINIITLKAQLLTLSPGFATQNDAVTVTFDASLGNAGLLGESICIAHTGVITTQSNSPSDWRYVQGQWGVNFAKTRMTSLGNNKWSLSIANIKQFYGVPAGEDILKLAFVFHNANGSNSKKGADIGGADIFVPISDGSFQIKFVSPLKHSLVNANDSFVTKAICPQPAALFLYANGNLVDSVTSDTVISYKNTSAAMGSTKINWVVKAQFNNNFFYDSSYVVIKQNGPIATAPANLHEGINYLSDTSVGLMIFAPGKNFIYVLGDFNNWEFDPNFLMNRIPGGAKHWIIINGLEPNKEYAFQYVVDDEKIRIPDPYTDKILDPFHDINIPAITYPNLKPYPTGKTTDLVSILQTAQQPFNWQYSQNFNKPAPDRLVIYELLVRDFIARHDYQTLVDTLSYLKRLGINAIELMPVNEFDGNESWGYNPNLQFAPDKYYGTKNDLKAFIDACHKEGIAVILDLVLNHAWGLSPHARLYFNSSNGKPAANNPWLNQDATHPFNVGYDYNHESVATQFFVDTVLKYWVNEYKIDGYRFDLSKGFTQKNSGNDVGAWSAYDQTRVNLWKRIRDEFRKTCSDCYMMLEHLGENSEEKVLAAEGFMLWGKMTDAYNQNSMGYASNNDLAWADYKTREFSAPHLITYAESHDEERLMFKNISFGASNGNYNVKNLNTALKRMEAVHAILLPLRGPKLMWQFGELGYDVSIDQNGRTGNKPILWNYQSVPVRNQLYQVIAALNKLKSYDAVNSNNYVHTSAANSLIKLLKISDTSFNTLIVSNFNLTAQTFAPNFQNTGMWYNYLTSDSIPVNDVSQNITLAPGEYVVLTTKRLNAKPVINTSVAKAPEQINFNMYPNPATGQVTIVSVEPILSIELRDVCGKLIIGSNKNLKSLNENFVQLDISNVASGSYFITTYTGRGSATQKLLIER